MPKHSVIERRLRQSILQGRLRPGDKLPPDESLTREFSCSRGTVRRAMQTLINEGLVAGVRGAGTFVRQNPREKTFGVIVPNVSNPDHTALISAVSAVGAGMGYRMMVYVTASEDRTPDEWHVMEKQCIEEMAARRIAGVLKAPTDIPAEPEYRALLTARGLRYVILNDFYMDRRGEHHVLVDERANTAAAVKHLADLGHRRIGFWCLSSDAHPEVEASLVSSAASLGLPPPTILPGRWPLDEVIPPAMAEPPGARITALITTAYPYVVWIHDQLRKMGLRAPEDLSLLNLGGLPVHSPIEFTSFAMPMTEMVRQAVALPLAEDSAQPAVQAMYRSELRQGQTTAPPPQSGAAPELPAAPGAPSACP